MHLLVHMSDSLKTPILSLVLTELSRPVLTFPLAYRQSNSAYLHIYQCTQHTQSFTVLLYFILGQYKCLSCDIVCESCEILFSYPLGQRKGQKMRLPDFNSSLKLLFIIPGLRKIFNTHYCSLYRCPDKKLGQSKAAEPFTDIDAVTFTQD